MEVELETYGENKGYEDGYDDSQIGGESSQTSGSAAAQSSAGADNMQLALSCPKCGSTGMQVLASVCILLY